AGHSEVPKRMSPVAWSVLSANVHPSCGLNSNRGKLPIQPLAQRTPHDLLFVVTAQPGEAFREKRNRLAIGAGTRQLGEIRSPEHPIWTESVIDAADVLMQIRERIWPRGVARHRTRLHRDIRTLREWHQRIHMGERLGILLSGRDREVI